jgi:hypothetical protein
MSLPFRRQRIDPVMRLILPVFLLCLSLGQTGAAMADAKSCPPGLAKKTVPCVPPGQAKKWALGDSVPINVAWYEVRDWDLYGLPEPIAGSRYIRIENDVLRVAIATGVILEYLGVFN